MQRLVPGCVISWKDKHYTVLDLEGLDHALIRPIAGKRTTVVPVSELQPAVIATPGQSLQVIEDSRWQDAADLFQALRPLIELPKYSRKASDIDAVATKLGKSRDAIYKHLKTWEVHQRLSAFVRKERSDKGSSKLDADTGEVIEGVLTEFHNKGERPTEYATWEEVSRRCTKAGLPIPSESSVVRRIRKQAPRTVEAGRHGSKSAREKFEPIRGSFPGADFPLAVVQIDHTPADIIFVDELERKPIGRCFLTLVIDVCTRMVCGFSVSLDHPGALSAALALSHAILPKDNWLRERDIGASWPIWGIPRKVHADNAKEFRGTALSRGCAEHNIILENRPKGQPQYGGHIERSLRTFMRATQRIKGTTFSNVAQKGDYDSEGKAIMTIAEYELWLATFLVYRYHHKKHKGIGYPPINLFNKHVKGDETTRAIGHPAPIANPRRLMLDFFPHFRATVQTTGIVFDSIYYWEDCLRRWVNVKEGNTKRSRRFVVAYDPRNLSVMYFYDPDLKEYLEIPYRDRSRPPISVWDLAAAKKWIKSDPSRQTNEEMVFEGHERCHELETKAEETTKQVRRKRARRASWDKDSLPSRKTTSPPSSQSNSVAMLPAAVGAPTALDHSSANGQDDDDDLPVLPFESVGPA